MITPLLLPVPIAKGLAIMLKDAGLFRLFHSVKTKSVIAAFFLWNAYPLGPRLL